MAEEELSEDRAREAGDARPRRRGRLPSRTYLLYRGLGIGLLALPDPLAVLAGRAVGAASYRLRRARREVVRRNLGRVLRGASEAEIDRRVRAAFRSYADYWVDGARLALLTPDRVARTFSVEGIERLDAALAEGHGALLALPHLGMWEIGGYFLARRGTPMTTVAERVEPEDLFEWFVGERTRIGLRVLPAGSGATGELVRVLREGGLVGLVADRDLAGGGVEVELFGERTTLPAGPALLALRAGAPLFPAAVYQVPGRRYHGVVRPALEVRRTGRLREDVSILTQALAREFEELIRRAPEQWHLFQPHWPADRPTGSAERPRPKGSGEAASVTPGRREATA